MSEKRLPMETVQPAHDAPGYSAYLLRLWQDKPGGTWRIMLKDARNGQQYGFADLDYLSFFLQNRMVPGGDGNGAIDGSASNEIRRG